MCCLIASLVVVSETSCVICSVASEIDECLVATRNIRSSAEVTAYQPSYLEVQPVVPRGQNTSLIAAHNRNKGIARHIRKIQVRSSMPKYIPVSLYMRGGNPTQTTSDNGDIAGVQKTNTRVKYSNERS